MGVAPTGSHGIAPLDYDELPTAEALALENSGGQKIFLSYSRKDTAVVRAAAQLLQGHGWSVWIDRDDIDVGKPFRAAVADAIAAAPCVVVFWSSHSVASAWVCSEAEAGLQQQKLLPVLLEPCAIPMPFGTYQAADLTQWRVDDAQDRQVKNLLGAITRFVAPVPPIREPAPAESRAVSKTPAGQSLQSPSAASGPAEFDAAYVVSDLLLYSAPGRTMGQGRRLTGLINTVTDLPPEQRAALIINGNLLDFGNAEFDGNFAVSHATGILDDAWSEPSLVPVWAALARLVATPNRRLVLVLGNIDVELALPEPAERLLQRLSRGDELARSRVSMISLSVSYRCRVGKARVLVQHGHHVDPWNVVDTGELARICDELLAGAAIEPLGWIPNAGRLVQRRLLVSYARRYPFLELLKPETEAAVPSLMALDPAGVMRGALGLCLDARLWSLLRHGRQVTQRYGRVDGTNRSGTVVDSGFAPGAAMPSWLRVLFSPRGDRLRRLLRRSLARDTTFSLRTRDEFYRDIVSRVGDGIEFIVAGHTRLERAIDIAPGRQCYYNTGTWARLIRLGAEVLDDPQAFAAMFAALEAGSLQAIDEATVPLGSDGRAPLVLQRATVLRIAATAAGAVGELFHVFDDSHQGVRLEPLVGTRFECVAAPA